MEGGGDQLKLKDVFRLSKSLGQPIKVQGVIWEMDFLSFPESNVSTFLTVTGSKKRTKKQKQKSFFLIVFQTATASDLPAKQVKRSGRCVCPIFAKLPNCQIAICLKGTEEEETMTKTLQRRLEFAEG